MRRFASLFLFFTVSFLYSQDKIYLLNGELVRGKVLEIFPESIKVEAANETITIDSKTVLLIEFSKGGVEIINRPSKDAIHSENKKEMERAQKNLAGSAVNLISLNALAVCNSDIALFYERLNKKKEFGIGGFTAFNFNSEASLINAFLSPLNNAKKKFELGAFANYYPGLFKNKTTFYLGLMAKYLQFDFSQTIISTNGVKYSPASGNQMAGLFTIGTHTNFKKNFFLKTLFGFGGFTLRGAYREELNLKLNSQGAIRSNRSFLPKVYLGINLGFSL